jgi:formylglycine-generating enzyme required for sulfatase activity
MTAEEERPVAKPLNTAKPVPCTDCPKMVKLSGGFFLMGATDEDEEASKGEKPRHEVTLPPFAIAETEVTQRLWLWVMNENPSFQQGCMDCPVEKVSFDDVQAFLLRLNAMTGQTYRLPTEAEWEYACRGSEENSTYCGSGEKPETLAWYNRNSDGVRKVKAKKANAFGLYDMSGNVWEWTADCWSSSYGSAPTDGSAWVSRECPSRVIRGGSWQYKSQYLGATIRAGSSVDALGKSDGVRVARTLP